MFIKLIKKNKALIRHHLFAISLNNKAVQHQVTRNTCPNRTIPTIIGVEIIASAMLMSVIYLVVYTKGLKRFGGIAIGGIVGLDMFFLAFISGASMNPARSLTPDTNAGVLINLWLYCYLADWCEKRGNPVKITDLNPYPAKFFSQ